MSGTTASFGLQTSTCPVIKQMTKLQDKEILESNSMGVSVWLNVLAYSVKWNWKLAWRQKAGPGIYNGAYTDIKLVWNNTVVKDLFLSL